MRNQTITIKNRFGETLEVLFRKPFGQAQDTQSNGQKFPAVLFVSGLGMDLHEWNNSFDEISQLLVGKGYLTLQFSFSGCGKSEGDYKEMTFERQARQIEDMLDYLKTRDDINVQRIGLIAQSCGVPSTLLADVSNIQSMIFISGAFNPYENLKDTFIKRNAYNPTGISALPRSSGATTSVGKSFWNVLKQFHQNELLQKLTIPVLVIHGDVDDKIPDSDAKHASTMLKNGRYKLFSGGNHGIVGVSQKMWEEFLVTIVHWFKDTLQ